MKDQPMGRRKPISRTGDRLFAEDQKDLFEKSYEEQLKKDKNQPVECLGITFPNDEKRREYFLEKLRGKLKDPEFRKIEGFPIGSDEDILALSDPPYYTACPNPFIADFIKYYGKPYDPKTDNYRREPFAADVSEGKNDPIYNAHSYHTKVPHKAIMRYILHYTEPGDIVFDGFCGTGMTGVAAQLCEDKDMLEALGFSVNATGVVFQQQFEENSKATLEPVSKVGPRLSLLNDLSPAATLIAAGYNLTSDPLGFAKTAKNLLDCFLKDHGWMFETIDPQTNKVCAIDYTVWSEIFACPHCSGELEFWTLAYDDSSGRIDSHPKCTHCKAEISKKELQRKMATFFDSAMNETRKRQSLKPVLIHYTCNGKKKQKKPDDYDFTVLKRAEDLIPKLNYPTERMMFVDDKEEWGDLYRGYHAGISRVHDFYLPRQLVAASLLWTLGNGLKETETRRLWRFLVQSVMVSFTRRNRFLANAFSQVNRALSGTLYLGSTVSEPSPAYVLSGKIRRFDRAIPKSRALAVVTSQGLASLGAPSQSVDYVFIDPPFGDNLPNAELNFLWEAWLRVFTRSTEDVVVSATQKKDLAAYTRMMTSCLKEIYRVLKPGRWITIEFHNSKNVVWTAIQEALSGAGFVIADVRVLDKGMLTKKQLNPNAVNKDLVISAYKPNGGLEERFKLSAGLEEGVWDFVRSHLRQLPVFVARNRQAETIVERQSYMVFDRMVAFHVQRGVTLPLSAADFYQGLSQRFPERDSMYFLSEQAAGYDKKRMTVKEVLQLELFVRDESSAIQWLKQQLTKKPQTFQELQPQFMKEIGGWEKHEKPLELSELLEQNFLRYDGKVDVPSQIHSYLSTNFKELRNLAKYDDGLRSKAKDRWYVPDPNKAGDLEKLRERALLREFQEYLESKQKKLKVFRLEAVRAGFKKAWQERNYQIIIEVAKKISEDILQEDPKLLMWYDQAVTRSGEEG
jgi:hypothetical protein